MRAFWKEMRYGARRLVSKPLLSLVAIVTLALGIGATTAIFSVVDTVLLQPLPYKDAGRLVRIYGSSKAQNNLWSSTSMSDYYDYSAESRTLTGIGAFFRFDFNVVGGDDRPQRLSGAFVSHNLFDVFEVEPMLGRGILPEEDLPGGEKVVLLSYGLWQTLFGGDPKVIDRTLRIDDEEHRIVGVMPQGFAYPESARLWKPFAMGADPTKRQTRFLRLVGRMAPGVTLGQVRSEMSTIADRLAAEYPETNTGRGANVASLRDRMVGEVRPALLILMGAAVLVLLIACGNLVNLILAGSSERQTEINLRRAVGAGPGQVFRQFLGEGLLLALVGGGVAVVVAYFGVEALVRFVLAEGQRSFVQDSAYSLPRLQEVGVDVRALGFTGVMVLLTGLLISFWPARRVGRASLGQSLREGTAGGVSTQRGRRLQRLLVMAQVAVALTLTVAAGLLVRTFYSLQQVDPGFDGKNVLTAEVALPWSRSRYTQPHETASFYTQLLDRAQALPGVVSAGAIWGLPMSGIRGTTPIEVEGQPESDSSDRSDVRFQAVMGDYFGTLGVDVLEGRSFTHHDDLDSAPVVVINQALARRYWPGESPLGRRLSLRVDFGPAGRVQDQMREVVGVVADTRNAGLTEAAVAELYLPLPQITWRMMTLVLRTNSEPYDLVSPLSQEVWAIDPAQPISNFRTMDEIVAATIVQTKVNMVLLSVFAGVALVLAMVGVYGMMQHSVQQRTREVGLRMAFGALPRVVVRQMVFEGLRQTGAGLLVGIVLALALSRVLRSLLFGVSATDVGTFLGVSLVCLAVAFLASYLPARRVARIQPLDALRHD